MASVEDLERRLQVLEDERALRQLLSRYSFNADLGRSREYVALYTEDGVIDYDSGLAAGRFQGHEDLLWKFITGTNHKSIEGRSQHHTQPESIFYIDGDEATAEGYSITLVREHDGIRIRSAVFNRWKFLRVNGEWKIRERFLRASPATDVIVRTKA